MAKTITQYNISVTETERRKSHDSNYSQTSTSASASHPSSSTYARSNLSYDPDEPPAYSEKPSTDEEVMESHRLATRPTHARQASISNSQQQFSTELDHYSPAHPRRTSDERSNVIQSFRGWWNGTRRQSQSHGPQTTYAWQSPQGDSLHQQAPQQAQVLFQGPDSSGAISGRRSVRPQLQEQDAPPSSPPPLSANSTAGFPNSLIYASDFMIGSGMVILQPSTGRIVVVHDERTKLWFLPKGRKDVGESLEQAALREAYEEVSLMRVIHLTRRTLK